MELSYNFESLNEDDLTLVEGGGVLSVIGAFFQGVYEGFVYAIETNPLAF